MTGLSEPVGISPARTRTASSAQRGSAARLRNNSSEKYADVFIPENLAERFSNARTPEPRRPVLNTEERSFVNRT